MERSDQPVSEEAESGSWVRLQAVKVDIGGGWQVALAWSKATAIRDLKDPEGWIPIADGVEGISASDEESTKLKCNPRKDRQLERWLILQETQPYSWEIWHEGSSKRVEPSSSLAQNRGWDRDKIADRCAGSFQIVNYCGRAFLGPKGDTPPLPRLDFEIEPAKFEIEEYRRLSEALEQEVQQLLVGWSTPTSEWRSAGLESGAVLAEKFAFLSNGIGTLRLGEALDHIRRNPHRALKSETRWSPPGEAHPGLFLRDPLRHGRDWAHSAAGPLPLQIEESRKFDSYDTAPNRFVKFALLEFLAVCESAKAEAGKPRGSEEAPSLAALDATRIAAWIEETLDHAFFEDVGELHRIPFDNPTLQSREGYRQILGWWIQLDAVGKVEWEGKEEFYQAPDRSLDKLYEYWLFLALRQMLLRDAGHGGLALEEIRLAGREGSGISSFVEEVRAADGTQVLRVRLAQGRTSLSCFRWWHAGPGGNDAWRIHLYYNRRFGHAPDPRYPGSYSAYFTPDFTLMAFPDPQPDQEETDVKSARKLENQAEGEEAVTYWHFDAKYKVDQAFYSSFGKQEEDPAGKENPGGESEGAECPPDSDSSVEEMEEKQEIKSEGRFKRADLFKMHAYNDAIRRTAGSYILYPGSGAAGPAGSPETRETNRFRKFHEIIPGVGAFVVRPEVSAAPLADLAGFLDAALRLRRRPGSNLNRVRDAEYQIGHGIEFDRVNEPVLAVIGWYRFQSIAKLCLKKDLFYWQHTDSSGKPTAIDPRISNAKWLFPYTTGKLCGVRREICGVEIISREALLHKFKTEKTSPNLLASKAKEYGVFQLGKSTDLSSEQLANLCRVSLGGIRPDNVLSLAEFMSKGHRPLVIPYESLFEFATS